MLIDPDRIDALVARMWSDPNAASLGEMMAQQPKAKPPGGSEARPRKDRVSEKPDHLTTLAEAGIDKNLADRARKLERNGLGAPHSTRDAKGSFDGLRHNR